MNPKTQNRLLTIGWAVVLALLLVLACRIWPGNRKNEVKIPDSDWAKLMLVLRSVDRDYVDPIDQKAVTEQILPDILAKLDPHSLYLPPVEMEEAEQRMNENEKIRELKAARKDFQTMMDNVNRILRVTITGEIREDDIGCSGNCGGCTGCG